MEGEIITKEKQPDIYKWLNENVLTHTLSHNSHTLRKDNKINVYHDLSLKDDIREVKYPFGYVKGYLSCTHCNNLTSLINLPEKIEGWFSLRYCDNITSLIGFPKYVDKHIFLEENNFSNNPDNRQKYNLYVDMWFELLESVSENEKWEYINNYKDKVDGDNICPIIPKEIINKYKIDFLLNDK